MLYAIQILEDCFGDISWSIKSISTKGLPYPYPNEFHLDREENPPSIFPIPKYLEKGGLNSLYGMAFRELEYSNLYTSFTVLL